jgi:hypothetical protein
VSGSHGWCALDSAGKWDDAAAPSAQSLILVKTHLWDDSFLARAAKYSAVANADFCYLVDETTAAIDTAPYRKIPFCVSQFAEIGLATVDDIGRGVVWENGDYPLYLAYLRHPAYRYYWMIEYDVLINFDDYNEFFDRFAAVDLDLIGALGRADQGYQWYAPAARMFAEVWGMFFPMMRLSNRALAYALCKRLIRSYEYRNAVPADRVWPHCEAWLASALCGQPGFVCVDINSLGTTYYQWLNEYGSRPHLLEDLESRAADRRIYHPVLSGPDYVDKAYYWYVVRTNGADADEVGMLLAALDRLRRPELAEPARQAMARMLQYRELQFDRERLDRERLVGRSWRFGRADGTTIAEGLTLLPDGAIGGYVHRNEHRWAIEDGRLLLLRDDGVVTTAFDEVHQSPEDGLILRGPFADSPQVMHVLEESPPAGDGATHPC